MKKLKNYLWIIGIVLLLATTAWATTTVRLRGAEDLVDGAMNVYRVYSAFPSLVTQIGSSQKTVEVWDTQAISANVTVPANVTVKMVYPGKFTVAANKTLTINGPFEAGLYQVFSCSGTGRVVFGTGAVEKAYPEWWGASPGAAAAVNNAAFTAVLASGAKHISLPQTGYNLSATWTFNNLSNVSVKGRSSMGSTLTWAGAASGTIVSIVDSHYLSFENVKLEGADIANIGFDCQASVNNHSTHLVFSQCQSGNNLRSGWRFGKYTDTGTDNTVVNVSLIDCYSHDNLYNVELDSVNVDQINIQRGWYANTAYYVGAVLTWHRTQYHFRINRGKLYLFSPIANDTRKLPAADGYVLYCKTGAFQWYGFFNDLSGYDHKTGFVYMDTPDLNYIWEGLPTYLVTRPQSSLTGVRVRGNFGGPDPGSAAWIYMNSNCFGLTVKDSFFSNFTAHFAYKLNPGAHLTSIGNKYACAGWGPWATNEAPQVSSIGDQLCGDTSNYHNWYPLPTQQLYESRLYGYDYVDADQDIAGLSEAAACVVTWASHGLVTGDQVYFKNIKQTGWTGLNNNIYTITKIDANSFSIPVNTSALGAYVPGTDPGKINHKGQSHGQCLKIQSLSIVKTGLSGATVTWSNGIPAGSMVIGVTARVITAITGVGSFDIGDGATADKFGNNVAVALGTTSTLADGTATAPTIYPKGGNIILTANDSKFTAGAVRLTVWYIKLTPPSG